MRGRRREIENKKEGKGEGLGREGRGGGRGKETERVSKRERVGDRQTDG